MNSRGETVNLTGVLVYNRIDDLYGYVEISEN